MVSHKYRCIFIHIPKTGGSSIESLLWPKERYRQEDDLWGGFVDEYHNKYQTGGLQHLLAPQVKDALGEKVFSNYFKFAMVRNPWDRFISQFHFLKKRTDLQRFIGIENPEDIKEYAHLIRKRKHVQWEKQVSFLYDASGALMVDYIGRFEQFENETSTLCYKLGNTNNKTIPHLRKTNRKHYRYYYDEELKEMVANLYKEDILMFNYTF